jgi:ubiquinone/menaquinone biosynthesis C-methylase UbiE
MHHLKAVGRLNEACKEVKRVLMPGGLFCVSDRLPTLYNCILIKLNYLARKLFRLILRIAQKEVLLSGSDNEPYMNREDYSIIYNDMEVIAERRWKSFFVFWLYGAQQFIDLLITEERQIRLAKIIKRFCQISEKSLGDNFKTDICVTLKKRVSCEPV